LGRPRAGPCGAEASARRCDGDDPLARPPDKSGRCRAKHDGREDDLVEHPPDGACHCEGVGADSVVSRERRRDDILRERAGEDEAVDRVVVDGRPERRAFRGGGSPRAAHPPRQPGSRPRRSQGRGALRVSRVPQGRSRCPGTSCGPCVRPCRGARGRLELRRPPRRGGGAVVRRLAGDCTRTGDAKGPREGRAAGRIACTRCPAPSPRPCDWHGSPRRSPGTGVSRTTHPPVRGLAIGPGGGAWLPVRQGSCRTALGPALEEALLARFRHTRASSVPPARRTMSRGRACRRAAQGDRHGRRQRSRWRSGAAPCRPPA
jgi:hypothetical protein